VLNFLLVAFLIITIRVFFFYTAGVSVVGCVMSDGVWRNFRFFESEPLPSSSSLAELNAVCSCLTPTALVVGDYEGRVVFVDRHASGGVICSFQAYAGAVTHVKYAALRNTLVTIGDDDALSTAILRVWDLDQIMNLYRGLLDSRTNTSCASAPAATPATTALRWRPPCQEHRLLTASKGGVAGAGGGGGAKGLAVSAAAVGDLPLVPILLQESKQLQYSFRPSSLSPSSSPPPSSANPFGGSLPQHGADSEFTCNSNGSRVVSCGSIRSAVVSFDVAPDLSCAAIGLVSRDCVVLKGDLAKERSVRAQTLRSGLAKGGLTFVGLPSPQYATLVGDGGHKESAVPGEGVLAGKAKTDGAPSLPTASANVQLLYTVHEDVVTCWALRANGNWSEYPCPTAGGAPTFGAALTARGELLVLGKHGLTHAAGSRIARLGPPPPSSITGSSSAAGPIATDGSATAASVKPYDPTVKACVQTFDVDHAPGRCFLYTYRHYLALVVQQEGRPEQFQLQCYDLVYKIRGLSRAQESYVNCAAVLADDTDLLVLFQDPAVRSRQLSLRAVQLREVNTQTKLELLFSKECYGIAQQLAKTVESGDPSLQMRIRKTYGDYLYQKGKFSEAMSQYVETIGHLESSYVIRRYMGSAHMNELIHYLEELHNQRHSAHANVAHTTLLLRCYHKRNDAVRLNAFIHRDDVRFDPQNAVEVCRAGGYAEAALYIADRYAQVFDCARIRLYDLHEPLATLAYLRTLGVDEVEGICAQLGKDLLALAPRATTELLMELCVYWKGPGRRLVDTMNASSSVTALSVAVGGDAAAGTRSAVALPFDAPAYTAGGLPGGGPRHTHHANAAAFLHIFVDAPLCLMNFLRAVVESGVLDEEDGDDTARSTATAAAAAGTTPKTEDKQETVSTTRAVDLSSVSPHAVLYNTLLELYITRDLKATLQLVPSTALPLRDKGATTDRLFSSVASDDKRNVAAAAAAAASENFPAEPYDRRLEQARTFLEAYKGRYDHYLALSLAHQHHFQDGILYLLRSLGLSEEILGYYSAKLNDPEATQVERQEATTKLFEACQESPGGDSGTAAMWMTLLSQLVRTPQTAWQDIVKVLDYIEAHDALPPVVVLEILSSHPQNTLQLRTVRDYCQRCLLKQTRQVQAVLTQTAQRLGEVERVKAEVTALQTSAVVFQTTACAHCHQPLDAPTVYFMCKHAFHHRCLYTATECNICAVAHRQQLDGIRETQQRDEQRQNPSSFTARYFQDVKAAGAVATCRGTTESTGAKPAEEKGSTPRDGFQVVADYVARGILGAPPLYKDAGLFGVEAAVPLRIGGDKRRDAEETLNADDLTMW
jgi:vacuolar protein sorting-associated protein 11